MNSHYIYGTYQVDLPKKELLLAGRDEPSMYDESSQADEFKDDPKYVCFSLQGFSNSHCIIELVYQQSVLFFKFKSGG